VDWDSLRSGLLDELIKIADVDLQNVSPEIVEKNSMPPPPFESVGFKKAQEILNRASMPKTAARTIPGYAIGAPQYRRLTGKKNPKDATVEDKAKNVGGNVIAGMGIGRLLTEYAHGPNRALSQKAKWLGMTGGAGIGLANAVRQHIKAKKTKTAVVASPGLALKSTQQVGKFQNIIHGGRTIRGQLSGQFLGRRFIP
jgi:hypothetical protein